MQTKTMKEQQLLLSYHFIVFLNRANKDNHLNPFFTYLQAFAFTRLVIVTSFEWDNLLLLIFRDGERGDKTIVHKSCLQWL